MRFFIAFFLIISSSVLFSQSDIDYNNKSLFNKLQKLNNNNDIHLKEIIIRDSILKKYRIHGKYFFISDSIFTNQIKYVYIGRVNSCRTGGCSISRKVQTDENHEYFDYFILYDSAFTIKLIKVFNYQATYGQEVRVKGWLKQFIGYNGNNDLQVGKDVDAISGATISVLGITFDIQVRTKILKELLI